MAELSPDAYKRIVVEPIPLRFQTARAEPDQDPNEQEFIMAMLKSREEGKAEARAEAQANAVLTVLRVRGIEVPEAARERILAEKDLDQFTRRLEKAAVASTIGDVLDESR